MKMMEEGVGYAPEIVMMAAPLEIVLAIICFNIFASMESSSPSTAYPWVKPLPVGAQVFLIPVNMLFSSVLGSVAGYAVFTWISFRENTSITLITKVTSKTTAEYLFVILVLLYGLYMLCTPQYIQQSSGVLAVIVASLTLGYQLDPQILSNLQVALNALWVPCEVFLFTLTGTSLSFKSNNGPLQSNRGFAASQVGLIVGTLVIGQIGRVLGILFVQGLVYRTLPKHKKDFKYLLLWALSTWMFQVQ